MVEKKSEFVVECTFSRYEAKISPTRVIDPEKTPRRKIFWKKWPIQKWPFKAPFAYLRLADTELAAPRSYRQIKVLVVVFRFIENFNLAVAGEATK